MSNQLLVSNKKLFVKLKFDVTQKIRLYFKKAKINPAWLLMSVLGRFLIFRSFAQSLKKPHQQTYDLDSSVFEPVDTEVIYQKLIHDASWGGLKLPQSIVESILKFATGTECYGNSNPDLGFKISQKDQAEQESQCVFNFAQYFNVAKMCPVIEKLATDPMLLKIAGKYLGREVICTGTRLWWIFPEAVYDPMTIAGNFHYDMNDYHSLMFFFYLTDVDINGGPHIYVRGSHKNKNFTSLFSPFRCRSDKYVADYYGKENIVTICGESGYGFVEDTFCYHKATIPKEKNRLMLQIQYAINDYGIHNDFIDTSILKNILDISEN